MLSKYGDPHYYCAAAIVASTNGFWRRRRAQTRSQCRWGVLVKTAMYLHKDESDNDTPIHPLELTC